MDDRSTRILLLGPAGSRKTSLLHSFLHAGSSSSATQHERVPSQLPIVSLPGLYGTTVYIVDGSKPDSRGDQEHQVWTAKQTKRADAVVLCTGSATAQDHDRATTEQWIAKTHRESSKYVPIILTVTGDTADPDLLKGLAVEACIECSPHQQRNVSEGQHILLMLLATQFLILLDLSTWQSKAKLALCRIARLLARSSTHLSPVHIARLQARVFGNTFSDETEATKILATAEVDEKHDAEAAFLALMHALIARGRAENVWRVLRYYGYNTALDLESDYLEPTNLVEPKADGSEVLEFSEQGWTFLQSLWEEYRLAADGLSGGAIAQVFSTAPDVPAAFQTTPGELMGLEAWLAAWALQLASDYKKALTLLACLGFPQDVPAERSSTKAVRSPTPYSDARAAVRIVQKHGRQRSERRIYNCLVLGQEPAKHELITAAEGPAIVLAQSEIAGKSKFITLQSVPDASQLSSRKASMADLIIYAFHTSGHGSDLKVDEKAEAGYGVNQLSAIFDSAKAKLAGIPNLVIALDATAPDKLDRDGTMSALSGGVDWPAPPTLINPASDRERLLNLIKTSLLSSPRSQYGAGGLQVAERLGVGQGGWLVWSSVLAACVGGGYIAVQRGGLTWLQQYLRGISPK